MSDVPGHEPAPTDAELDEVRSLLAEARVEDPVPADVAARLDDVLAGLSAERAPADAAAGEDRRADVGPGHRRWAPRVLVAAAAVVVLGGTAYGVGRIAHSTGGASSGSSSASSVQSDRSSGGSAGGSSATPPAASSARQPQLALGSLPPLRTAHFAADARRALRGDLGALTRTAAGATNGEADTQKSAPGSSASPSFSAQTPACPGPTRPGTVGAVVRLDGRLAALVVHPAGDGVPGSTSGGTRLVQAWSCDGSTLLASAHVPVG